MTPEDSVRKMMIPLILTVFIALFSTSFGDVTGFSRDSLNSFSCESASGNIITEEFLKSENIKYMIYGNPNSLENFRKTLDSILDIIREKDQIDSLMYIVDFRGYPGILNHFIKENLKSNEKQMGIRIYADWSGKISLNQSFEDDKVYFLILDSSLKIEKILITGKVDAIRQALLNL